MTASATNVLDQRLQLCAAGYIPIPLFGKVPPNRKNNNRKGFAGWEQTREVTREQLEMWSKTWPDASNTGLLTRLMPVLDADICSEEAARGVEDRVRERFEEHGHILVRIGKSPKRAIPFRTIEPFEKIIVNLTAPSGNNEKIEFLADGQQIAAFGIHPETNQPFRWFGGAPGEIKLEDLPYIRAEEAQALVDDLVQLLVAEHGYQRAKDRPRKARKANGGAAATSGPEDWKCLYDNILAGRDLHASLRDLAAKLIKSGTGAGAAVNQLRALMDASQAPRDDRWKDRFADIPRLVETAEELLAEKPAPTSPTAAAPSSIEKTLAVFDRWLILKDHTPILAMAGAIAANLLPGDPVWLGIIGPPSSAKTEILNSASALPNVVQAATLTIGGLLSGVPKKQQDKGARGGLLRQLGDFGIILLKDFGSILSMHTETRAEVLAALREIYDGSWTRHLGTGGGKTLAWTGKVALVFAATGVIDSHYAVIGAMGDRFLSSRLAPTPGQKQLTRAIDHVGSATKTMREELAAAVAALFAGRKSEPRPISEFEVRRLGAICSLVVRLRGAVERDRRTRELECIYGAEGTARVGLMLERLLAGLDTLGVERAAAFKVVETVALDSVPPLRREAYRCVDRYHDVETKDVAIYLDLPTNTARRILEELAVYRLITRHSLGQGKADHWVRNKWEAEDLKAE
jgi:hypothetical protein